MSILAPSDDAPGADAPGADAPGADAPVLIAGGGMVGLCAAAFLAQRGFARSPSSG